MMKKHTHPQECSCSKCIIKRMGDGKTFSNYDFSPSGKAEFWRAEAVYTKPGGSHGSISCMSVYHEAEAYGFREYCENRIAELGGELIDFYIVRFAPAYIMEVVK